MLLVSSITEEYQDLLAKFKNVKEDLENKILQSYQQLLEEDGWSKYKDKFFEDVEGYRKINSSDNYYQKELLKPAEIKIYNNFAIIISDMYYYNSNALEWIKRDSQSVRKVSLDF